MFKRILIPVDFTDKNLAALDRAHQLAKWSNGAVTLLHVIERVENIPAEELKQFYDQLEQNAKRKLNQYAGTFTEHGIDVAEEIVYGRRGEEIVRSAVKGQFDLIVVGSHKVEAAQSIGTLSYQIAVVSPIPVLLVK